jgi:hypothetical protein
MINTTNKPFDAANKTKTKMHQEQNIIKIFDIPKLTMDCRN